MVHTKFYMEESVVQKIINQIIFRKGKLISLRPVSRDDIPQLTVWINDIETTKYLTVPYPRTLDDEIKWLENFNTKKTTDVLLAIRIVRTNKLIGLVGLHQIDYINSTATLSIAIGNTMARGKGYGKEAISMMIEYAFKTLNLRKICASTLHFNERSKACLLSCGFKEEGIRKEQFYKNGEYADEIQLAILKRVF